MNELIKTDISEEQKVVIAYLATLFREQVKPMQDWQRKICWDLITAGYCTRCGSDEGPGCQCWNDCWNDK